MSMSFRHYLIFILLHNFLNQEIPWVVAMSNEINIFYWLKYTLIIWMIDNLYFIPILKAK